MLTTGHVGGANVAVGATIHSGLAPGTQATFYFNTPAGIARCTYSDPLLNGNASNTGSVITFTNQTFTLSAGPSAICPPSGDFSATLGPNEDISVTGNPRVYVN